MDKQAAIKNQVKVFEQIKNGKPYIQFDFIGNLEWVLAEKAIEEWRQLMVGLSKKNLIYNCIEMSGFDTDARKIWQSTMSEFKPQIENIWIISSNMFILAAAKTMGFLTGFSIKVAKTLEEIDN